MKKVIILFLVLVCFTLEAEERQVPFDENGDILILSRKMAMELNIYREYEHFKEAILFQISEDSYILEITEEIDKILIRHRYELSAEEAFDLRNKITALVNEKRPVSLLDRSGRFSMLTGTFLLSYGFYGFSIPITLGIEDYAMATGIYLVTSGAGFFIPFFLTENVQITRGQAALSVGGALLGIIHGGLLHTIVMGNPIEFDALRSLMATSTIVSLAEGIGGYVIADIWNITEGEGSLITLAGFLGLGEGIGLSVLIHENYNLENTRAVAGEILSVALAGLVLGKVMTDLDIYTLGDSLIIGNAMLLGIQGALSLVLSIDNIDPRFIATLLMTGPAAGVVLSTILMGPRDFSTNQGNFISLATFGGSLIGAGLGYLINPTMTAETDWFIPMLGFIGGSIGFGTLFAMFQGRALPDSDEEISFSVSFHPEAIILSSLPAASLSEKQMQVNVPVVICEVTY